MDTVVFVTGPVETLNTKARVSFWGGDTSVGRWEGQVLSTACRGMTLGAYAGCSSGCHFPALVVTCIFSVINSKHKNNSFSLLWKSF